jgi:hypothetical protein
MFFERCRDVGKEVDMGSISSSLTSYLFGLFTSEDGLNGELANVLGDEGAEFEASNSIQIQNAPPDIAERAQSVRYPAIYLYCERLINSQREKFVRFSGKAKLIVEIRCSSDRIEGMEKAVERYSDAACRVLENARGNWQGGALYSGGYEVVYTTLKHGGKNFLQVAKISFDVDVTR